MNQAHLHLLLNHTPILGCLFELVLLAAGLGRPNVTLTRTGLVTLVVAALICIPTQLTGEGAEELVEDRPGVSHHLIHEHEEAAELSFWALELTGALALAGLLLPARTARPAQLAARLALLGAVISAGLLGRAGTLGGEIMHPEIREQPASGAPEH